MDPLAWLAIPLVLTSAAAILVPIRHRRHQRVLTDQERSAVLAQHLYREIP